MYNQVEDHLSSLFFCCLPSLGKSQPKHKASSTLQCEVNWSESNEHDKQNRAMQQTEKASREQQ